MPSITKVVNPDIFCTCIFTEDMPTAVVAPTLPSIDTLDKRTRVMICYFAEEMDNYNARVVVTPIISPTATATSENRV